MGLFARLHEQEPLHNTFELVSRFHLVFASHLSLVVDPLVTQLQVESPWLQTGELLVGYFIGQQVHQVLVSNAEKLTQFFAGADVIHAGLEVDWEGIKCYKIRCFLEKCWLDDDELVESDEIVDGQLQEDVLELTVALRFGGVVEEDKRISGFEFPVEIFIEKESSLLQHLLLGVVVHGTVEVYLFLGGVQPDEQVLIDVS